MCLLFLCPYGNRRGRPDQREGKKPAGGRFFRPGEIPLICGRSRRAVDENQEEVSKNPSPNGVGFLFVQRKPPARLGVPKSFSFAQSRRSGKPPSDEGGGTAQAVTEGEKQEEKYSLPQSCYSHDSPLVRGGRGCVRNRICGGRAEQASEG